MGHAALVPVQFSATSQSPCDEWQTMEEEAGACTQPLAELQESFVHTFPSSQPTVGPPTQVPLWQVSFVVQKLPSLQAVPFGAAGLEHVPVDGLHVPAT